MNPERRESRASTPGNRDADLGRNAVMRNSVRHADFACLLSPHHKSLSTKLLAMNSRQTVRGGRQFWTVSKASTVWTRQLVQVCALTGPRAGRTRRGGPAVPAPQAGGVPGLWLGLCAQLLRTPRTCTALRTVNGICGDTWVCSRS